MEKEDKSKKASIEFIVKHEVLACEIDGRKVTMQQGQIVPAGAIVYLPPGAERMYKGVFTKAATPKEGESRG